MNKEEMQNNYIEMLIQDLEKHSFDYWESTQDEMVEALRNLQQKVKQLETNRDVLKKWLEDTLGNEKYCYLAEKPEDRCRYNVFKEVLSKMQELERGKE